MTGHSNALAVNPADETIDYGPMAVRFLLTGENSTGSVAAFELTIGGGSGWPRRRTATITTRKPFTASRAC